MPTQCVYVFCMYLRTNRCYFRVQHKLIGFYYRDGVFSVRYELIFRCNSDNRSLSSVKAPRCVAVQFCIYVPLFQREMLALFSW
jgi:hypothetical protein